VCVCARIQRKGNGGNSVPKFYKKRRGRLKTRRAVTWAKCEKCVGHVAVSGMHTRHYAVQRARSDY